MKSYRGATVQLMHFDSGITPPNQGAYKDSKTASSGCIAVGNSRGAYFRRAQASRSAGRRDLVLLQINFYAAIQERIIDGLEGCADTEERE